MATEAYRQAWKALLEQREARQKSRGDGGGFRDGASGGGASSAKGEEGEALKGDGGGGDNKNDDEIGRILQQAKIALTIGGSSSSNRGTSRWSRGGTPQQQQRDGGTPGIQAAGRNLDNFEV